MSCHFCIFFFYQALIIMVAKHPLHQPTDTLQAWKQALILRTNQLIVSPSPFI